MKFLFLWSLALSATLSAASLTFEQTTKEIDVGMDDKTVTADFVFKNSSDKTVEVARADAGCSCIQAAIKGGFTYKPGQEGLIRAAFDLTGVAGTVDKPVFVWLKGDPEDKPSIKLLMRVKIPELIVMEPKTLFWEVGEEAKAKTVIITMKHTAPIKVISMSGADSRFKQELKTIEEGKKYEVVVTPANTDNVAMGVVHLETDTPSQRYRTQRIFMVVKNRPKAAASAAVTQP